MAAALPEDVRNLLIGTAVARARRPRPVRGAGRRHRPPDRRARRSARPPARDPVRRHDPRPPRREGGAGRRPARLPDLPHVRARARRRPRRRRAASPTSATSTCCTRTSRAPGTAFGAWSRRWCGTGTPLVCVGGDHGLAFPILRGVSQALPGKRIGVISVDAHFDVRITHHGEPSSGVPFRWIMERHPEAFSGRNLVEFGLAGWLNTKLYHDYLVEQGARLCTLRELRQRDWDTVVQEAFDHAADGTDAIWMTFDIDAIEGRPRRRHERAGDRRAVAVPGAGPGARVRAAPEGGRLRRDGGVAAAQPDRADGAPGGVAGARLRGRAARAGGPERAAPIARTSGGGAQQRRGGLGALRAQRPRRDSAKKSPQREHADRRATPVRTIAAGGGSGAGS